MLMSICRKLYQPHTFYLCYYSKFYRKAQPEYTKEHVEGGKGVIGRTHRV